MTRRASPAVAGIEVEVDHGDQLVVAQEEDDDLAVGVRVCSVRAAQDLVSVWQ